MSSLLCIVPCQSEVSFSYTNIHEKLFDKKVDKRYLESDVQKFLSLNKKMLDFLGITVNLSGVGKLLRLSFTTSNYIGAIPLKMPYDGLIHKDFQVTPRFENSKKVYAELTQLLSRLDYSIKPEYAEGVLLSMPIQLRPPLYYEAVKFLEYFEQAYNYAWVKFDTKDGIHTYPKVGTNWNKHALWSYDPSKALLFPTHDNVLSTNHKEWQELKYVFELIKEQITNPGVPSVIRFRYGEKVRRLSHKVEEIKALATDKVLIRAADPPCIKTAKMQANIVLQKSSDSCEAWRMDVAVLFERYVQFVVARGIHDFAGTMIPNGRFSGKGKMRSWGLRYLEPDIMVKIGDCVYVADAKYKANFFAQESEQVLKDTHRADLHQILAYCAFEPQRSKAGILFYPSYENKYYEVDYTDKFGCVSNRVLLCGLEFNVAAIERAAATVKKLFQEKILTEEE